MTIGSRLPPTAMPQEAGFADATPGKKSAFLSGASVQVTAEKTSTAEEVDPAVEGDLRRDDEIGMLFAKSFDLQAPELDLKLKD